jgi:hypothetical protein
MMKFVYIALIPILAVFIAIYAIMLLSYHPYVIDKNMVKLTDNLIKNSPALNIQELAAQKDTLQHAVPNDVWEKNLFDPNREGVGTGVSGSEGLKHVELVGIFDDGNTKGAVILFKTGESGKGLASSGYGSSRQSDDSSGMQKHKFRPPPKTVFKVGDRLPNGLILESVGNDFIMLHSGKESFKLNMTFSSDNSLKRMSEASKVLVKPPVTVISGAQGTAASSRQPGTGLLLPVTPDKSSGSSAQSQGIFQGYGPK